MSIENARNYYGQVLQGSDSLKTNACCSPEEMPAEARQALANVADEVLARYYGCGLVLPEALEGARILDLGCGAGRDVYLLAQIVGEHGHVTGVDATPEQLEVARRHEDWHRARFGYAVANTTFLDGEIEQLDRLGLAPASFDVIVSNCVINLCRDKSAVLAGARRLLKPGGELYFADIYADRRLPPGLMDDPVLHGECLGGALYWNDFQNLAKRAGFADPRLVADRPIEVGDPAIRRQLGAARFFSATYRLFNIEGLEPACEDHGQAVVYQGTLPNAREAFTLDKHHRMETGKMFPVCGNTFRMLHESRLRPHFAFHGDMSRHFGIFAGCGTTIPYDTGAGAGVTSGACC